MKNYNKKSCLRCGKKFTPYSANQKYCGSRRKYKKGCSFDIYREEKKEYKKTEKYKKWRRENCYEKEKMNHSDYRRRYRKSVLEHYGGIPSKCFNCGVDIFDVLEIDHIDNKGNQERKKDFGGQKSGQGSGTNFYRWLIKNNFPKGYQVLCKNCNWLKYLKYLRKK